MNALDFSELAALSVLDGLDQRDQLLIESYSATSTDLESELIELQMATAAIAYDNQPLSIPDHLKSRLFQRINSEPVETPIESDLRSFTIKVNERSWMPHPLVAGVSISILNTNYQKRQISALVRCEPNLVFPNHRHVEYEEMYMLEGSLDIDGKTYGVGDFIFSGTHSLHAPTSPNGCMFLVRTSLDDQFI